MTAPSGRRVYGCNKRLGGDTWVTSTPCPNAFDPADRDCGLDRIAVAARNAGWGVWNGRLYGISMGPVFTCPDCVARELAPADRPSPGG